MTARIVFTESADADADGIFADVRAGAGDPTALKYRAQFRRLFATLADFPKSGPIRRALGGDIRIGIVFPYVVIYDYDPAQDVVTILCIVHGRRKITGALLR